LPEPELTKYETTMAIMKTIASHNGLPATVQAYELLQQGKSPLDAVVAGVTLVEDDPQDRTVGYGGLPNEQGQVELDAAVMDGRTHRGAGVAGLRGVRHATQLAQRLMEQTHRSLLVGEGALEFARANGFPEEDLLTDQSRRMWLYWKRMRSSHDDWQPAPEEDDDLDLQQWFKKYFYRRDRDRRGGTVHCSAIDAEGALACATSTSGHAFKMAGRVGDSPILGAGLYVDQQGGCCGSIGHGEANLQNLSSFAVVDLMCQGTDLETAGLQVLQRIVDKVSPAECDEQGRPQFNLQLFVLAKDGAHAGISIWGGKQIAVADDQGARLEDCRALYEDSL
jgi:N4-(beta-N-acetylglucosaminyl)-L-asparaginase